MLRLYKSTFHEVLSSTCICQSNKLSSRLSDNVQVDYYPVNICIASVDLTF